MATRVLVLGAGFGGLELSSRLSEQLGDRVEVTLIDQAEAFVFGFSKLDVMFGRRRPDEIRYHYSELALPHVSFRRESIISIDPESRRVVTDGGGYEADVLVIALGADYDQAATPGLVESGNDFYSVAGAERLRRILPGLERGRVIIGVCGNGFKCPPAPSECALLLDEYLRERGRREAVEIRLVMPFGIPIPPSPELSRAILSRFAARQIEFIGDSRVMALDGESRHAILSDGSRLPYDLFLGIPIHRAPEVVLHSGLVAENGWIPVDKSTLATRYPDVYAIGDVTSVGTAKAGVFSERAARVVADQLIARIRGEAEPPGYDGTGTCYVELGEREVGKFEADFFSNPERPIGIFTAPSAMTFEEKQQFGSTRYRRWFGRPA